MHVFLVRAWAAALMAAVLPSVTVAATPSASNERAEGSTAVLLSQALQAELAGNNAERESLIAEAVRKAPNDPAARWHGGQVWFNGAWCSPAEVSELAKKAGRLAEYRQRRQSTGATAEEQAELARWCRRNKLDDEQRVHWLNVLSLQPNHTEAIKALKLQAFQGMLLPQEQVERLKDQQQQARKEAERWTTVVAQWRRAKSDPESFDRAALLGKFREIDEPAEMMGLEQALWQQVALKRDKEGYASMLKELAEGLRENPSPVATQFLARCAALGPTEEVRAAAIESLKKRPLDDFVPILLAGLRSPVDVNMNFDVDGAGRLITRCSYWHEGSLADLRMAWSTSVLSVGEPLFVYDRESNWSIAANAQRNIAQSLTRAGASLAQMRVQVEQINEMIESLNARICEVLRQLTGASLGDEPTSWWNWWIWKYNEFNISNGDSSADSSESYNKPQYDYEYSRKQVGASRPTYRPQLSSIPKGAKVIAGSCFAKGTPVWTLTGLRPIEELVIGDRVLAQDSETGELAYKAVLGVTIRPPGPRLKVTAGGESIIATPGHPFWVAGQGWRLTKQLAAGEPLHTLEGAVKIDAIQKAETPVVWHEGAYNLIVADFNTYFVGKRALLVHDNTPRQPTGCAIPGLKRK